MQTELNIPKTWVISLTLNTVFFNVVVVQSASMEELDFKHFMEIFCELTEKPGNLMCF